MLSVINESSTRIKTGIVLLIAMLVIGYIDSYFVFWLVFGIMLLISISEAKKLFGIKNDAIFVYTTLLWIAAYFYPKPEDLIFIVAIAYASQLAYKKTLNTNVFLPLLYPTASGAYFVGKSFGKTKFCETSPNKTIEGLIGGLFFAVVLGPLFVTNGISFVNALIISGVVSLASVFGDLFESYLKREADVKDSGTILPGHGGMLDRTDGYLFGAIVMLVLLRVVL